VKLVHLVGFIIKTFVTMQHGHVRMRHGHMKVKFNISVYGVDYDTTLQTDNVYMKWFLGAFAKSR
jgi:hypothetical protein